MNRMKQLREERGYSVRKLSNVIGIKFESISRYENEARDMSTDMLKLFAKFYEVTIDYLLGFSCYYIYLKYNNLTLKVNEDDYYILMNNKFISFDEDNHRRIDLNKLIGLDDDKDYSDLIVELNRCNKINELFDKNSFGVVNEEYVEKVINDVEIILDSKLVKFIRESVEIG